MSLVAYAVDSDEESEHESEDELQAETGADVKQKPTNEKIAENQRLLELEDIENQANSDSGQGVSSVFAKLPPPKTRNSKIAADMPEEADEFMHKTTVGLENNAMNETASKHGSSKTVKIAIPSMSEFCDVDMKYKSRGIAERSTQNLKTTETRGSKLLNMLPKAKTERNFAKTPTEPKQTAANSSIGKTNVAFVPDSVRFGRAARSTEDIEDSTIAPRRATIRKMQQQLNVNDDESEEEEESADFFSLERDEKLPNVSMNEINALVAARSAKIAATTDKYLQQQQQEDHETTESIDSQKISLTSNATAELDEKTLHVLAGRNAAKRARRGEEAVIVTDISGDEILPDRNEWMRTALASSTAYQPTGVIVDEEPVVGTRRKHQITYLAHKAKANEAELQAMWATNRQTRRATQSKYGF